MVQSSGKAEARQLPKRFYTQATVAAADDGQAWQVLLDGRPLRTPAKAPLQLPQRAVAAAVADEWAAQGTHIDPATMPLTRIANSTIDGVAARRAEVEAEIVRYACNDMLCYRADRPAALIARQAAAWDPIVAWASRALSADIATGQGISHVAQPAALADAVARHVQHFDVFALAALHVITTLTGSALLALAHAEGVLSAAELWRLAHVDEDFQIEQWGWDAEAAERRQVREQDMQAASLILGTRRH